MQDEDGEFTLATIPIPLPRDFEIRRTKGFKALPLDPSTTVAIEAQKMRTACEESHVKQIAEFASKYARTWPNSRLRRACWEAHRHRKKLAALQTAHKQRLEEKMEARKNRSSDGEEIIKRQKGAKTRFVEELNKDLSACSTDIVWSVFSKLSSDPNNEELKAKAARSVQRAVTKVTELFKSKWIPRIASSNLQDLVEPCMQVAKRHSIEDPMSLYKKLSKSGSSSSSSSSSASSSATVPAPEEGSTPDKAKLNTNKKRKHFDKAPSQQAAHREAKAPRSVHAEDAPSDEEAA